MAAVTHRRRTTPRAPRRDGSPTKRLRCCAALRCNHPAPPYAHTRLCAGSNGFSAEGQAASAPRL
eukprot:6172849-Pleurochrysis_carterae.AAC.2